DDGLVEHQQHAARAALEAAFEPPFDWRQVSGRSANWWRGRFQRISRRARARLTLRRDTETRWTSRKQRRKRSLGQPVERYPSSRGSRSITSARSGSMIPSAVGGRPERGASARRWPISPSAQSSKRRAQL